MISIIYRIVMECYYRSNLEVVRYIERMHMLWKEKGMFDVKEQRLVDRNWQIVAKKWFSDLHLNDMNGNPMGVTEESDGNAGEVSIGFSEEDYVLCKNESHVVL